MNNTTVPSRTWYHLLFAVAANSQSFARLTPQSKHRQWQEPTTMVRAKVLLDSIHCLSTTETVLLLQMYETNTHSTTQQSDPQPLAPMYAVWLGFGTVDSRSKRWQLTRLSTTMSNEQSWMSQWIPSSWHVTKALSRKTTDEYMWDQLSFYSKRKSYRIILVINILIKSTYSHHHSVWGELSWTSPILLAVFEQ